MLSAQESVLAMLTEPYARLKIESRPAVYKAGTLPAALSL